MSRADLNLRSKGGDHSKYPQKPGRTAARLLDQKRHRLAPRVRRIVAARTLAIRSARSQAAKAAKAAA